MQLVRLVSNQCDGLRERDMDQIQRYVQQIVRHVHCTAAVLYFTTLLILKH